jgi:hypothetical protein
VPQSAPRPSPWSDPSGNTASVSATGGIQTGVSNLIAYRFAPSADLGPFAAMSAPNDPFSAASQMAQMMAQIVSPAVAEDVDMSDPTREEIGAYIKASEAGTETKIARLEGKIDTLAATIVGKIDSLKEDVSRSEDYNRDTRWVLLATTITSVIALAGLIVAMATYGDALFGRGMNVRDVVQAVIKEQQDAQKRDTIPLPSPAPPVPTRRP